MEHKIKNVVFDVGNVLIDFCWERHCRRLGYTEDIIQSFGKQMVSSDCWDRMDEGTMEETEAIEEFVRRMPQYEAEIRKFWDTAEGFVEEYPYAAPMMDLLHKKGYKVYLLSNYPLHMYEIHWPTFAFFKKVDGHVVSAVERLKKPDPAIYHCLCDRYGLIPKECLFIDDRMENIEAARQVGMEGICFQSIEQLQKESQIFSEE